MAQATNSSAMRLSVRASAISALSTILPSSPARNIGMVLTTTAPALVAASQAATSAGLLPERIKHAIAGLDAVILDQRMRQPVRPVGELLIGAAAAIADQRDMVAEAPLDHAVGQFDRGVEALGILEFRAIQQDVRPLIERREIVAREGIDVCGRTELDVSSHVTPAAAESTERAMMIFWTSDAPS